MIAVRMRWRIRAITSKHEQGSKSAATISARVRDVASKPDLSLTAPDTGATLGRCRSRLRLLEHGAGDAPVSELMIDGKLVHEPKQSKEGHCV